MPSIIKVSSSTNSLTLQVVGLAKSANNYSISISCNGTTSSELGSGVSSTSASYTFNGLSQNTSYLVSASVYDISSDTFVSVPSEYFITDGLTPSNLTGLTVTSVTNNSVSLSWNTSSNATSYDISWSSGSGTTSSTSYTANGLNSNTSYTFTVTPKNGSTSGGNQSTTVTTSSTGTSRPSNFVWATAKTSGGNFNLTATEWNALMERINDFRAYKNLSRSSYTFASSGMNFTAAMFNQASNMIAVMNSYVPNTMFPGDDIYASDLNRLKDAINEIP